MEVKAAIREFEPLASHIQQRISVTQEELCAFMSCFRLIHVKKRQFIIQPDFPTKYRSYVVKGALRGYLADTTGEEHTLLFAIEDGWMYDFNSYINQQPASLFVVALEDSILLQIDYESEQYLKQSSHKFETFFRIMAEQSFSQMQCRVFSNLIHTAEQRYENFLNRYPLIAQRVPQYALASYLGMTTEFLSKIRNNKVKKKN